MDGEQKNNADKQVSYPLGPICKYGYSTKVQCVYFLSLKDMISLYFAQLTDSIKYEDHGERKIFIKYFFSIYFHASFKIAIYSS